MSPPDTLARLLAVGLVLAVLLNGAGFYLKRIGVLDPAIYADRGGPRRDEGPGWRRG